MLNVNDRVIYEGRKATVTRVWKSKARILTADMENLTVAIDQLETPPPGQLALFEIPAVPVSAGFTDWEMENGDIDETQKAIAPTETEWIGKFVECRVWPVSRGTIIADYDPCYWLAENENGKVLYRKGWVNPVDPNSIDPNSVDPNSIDPSSVDPSSVDPNSIDPNSIDPNSIDPNSIDPNSVDPNSVDPNSVDPNQDHPAKGYEEIKILKGREYRYWRWMDGKKKRSKYLGPVKPLKSPQP
jgi:hypothetical protein